eukprot:scaffold41675_cov53-Phaeocystis_antarctica.AAC.2
MTSLFNPLPAPGNGGHPETPLSRLTPNVGEKPPVFHAGHPTPTCMRNFGWLRICPKKAILNLSQPLAKACQNHHPAG